MSHNDYSSLALEIGSLLDPTDTGLLSRKAVDLLSPAEAADPVCTVPVSEENSPAQSPRPASSPSAAELFLTNEPEAANPNNTSRRPPLPPNAKMAQENGTAYVDEDAPARQGAHPLLNHEAPAKPPTQRTPSFFERIGLVSSRRASMEEEHMEEEGVNGLKRTPSFYERASGVLNDYARSFKAMITPRVLADEIPADDASDSESESGSEELEASTPKGTEDEVESPTATSFAAKEMTEMAEDALVEDVTSAAPVSPGPAGSIDLSELVSATEGDANGAEIEPTVQEAETKPKSQGGIRVLLGRVAHAARKAAANKAVRKAAVGVVLAMGAAALAKGKKGKAQRK